MYKNILYSCILFFFSCTKQGKHENDHGGGVYYTCSMDPQVVQDKPGKCPICKMSLTAVKKSQLASANELELSDQQIYLGNIVTDSLQEQIIGEDIMLPGTANVNQKTLKSISSRVMGRIERLYFKATGEFIKKGDPIYEVYSEDLNTTIKQLLLASEQKKIFGGTGIDYENVLQSTRNKLLLLGLTESQIHQIETSSLPPYTIKILSKTNGFIYSVDVKEGGYVMEGDDVFHLADFSTVWIDAQVYSDYLSEIKDGMNATISFPSLQKKEIYGKVSFVYPELNPSSKINRIRIEIPNTNSDVKPGMLAYVNLLINEKKALALPTDAVIKDAKGSTVWLKTGNNKFKSTMVHTGIESNGYTEILHGIEKGDVVIISGAYLLNSEYILKKGINPMEGHKM